MCLQLILCVICIPGNSDARLLASLNKGGTGYDSVNILLQLPQRRLDVGIPSTETFFPSELIVSTVIHSPLGAGRLTNCQLNLGLALGCRREGARDVGSTPAGPPSRPS